MKAIIQNEDRLKIGEIQDPPVGYEEVLVHVKAFGVHRLDLLQRKGAYTIREK